MESRFMDYRGKKGKTIDFKTMDEKEKKTFLGNFFGDMKYIMDIAGNVSTKEDKEIEKILSRIESGIVASFNSRNNSKSLKEREKFEEYSLDLLLTACGIFWTNFSISTGKILPIKPCDTKKENPIEKQ